MIDPLSEARLLADVALHSFTSAIDMLDEAASNLVALEEDISAEIEFLETRAEAAFDERKRSQRLAAKLRALVEE